MRRSLSGRTGRSAGRLLLVLVALLLLGVSPARAAEDVTLVYFWGEGCPFCDLQADFLDDLEDRYPDLTVERHEVWNDEANRQLFADTLRARGVEPTGVPATVLGDQVWVGFSGQVAHSIELAVEAALREAADDTPEPDDAVTPPVPAPVDGARAIELPVFGEIDLVGRPLAAATLLIGFVDGFNPCSLWVLTVLLAMVVNAGASRGRIAAVGVTFLTVTALIYGVFIAGLFSVLAIAGVSTWIALVVGTLAIGFGAVNVKDYLRYKQGLSFTIPDRYKPRIYRRGREIRRSDRSLFGVLGLTVAMASGVALLELPCTAGFPVIWTGLLTASGVQGAEFAGLLGLYLFMYLSVELVVFAVVLVTLRMAAFEERHGRILKLVGGVVMIALGGVLVVAPDLMESFAGSTSVVLGAIAVALLLLVLHRRILPRFGVHLGDEPAPERERAGTRR